MSFNKKNYWPEGKVFLVNQKIFNIFIAVFLSLGVFANGALAEACLCGQACSHGPQAKTKTKIIFLFHMRCPGNLCKTCELENGQSLKKAGFSKQIPNLKILHIPFFLSTLVDYVSTYDHPVYLDAFYVFGVTPSLPIYLKKHSLLC